MSAYRLLVLFVFSAMAATAIAPSASAFDLTGTWEGSWSCQGFDGVKFRSRSGRGRSTVLITQTGNTLAVDMDDGDYLYNGGAIPDGSSPTTKGEVVLAQCGTDNIPLAGPDAELIRAQVKVDDVKGKGSIKGLSVLESSIPDVLTCKYGYKRVSTVDPAVPACL